jgi:hypothetical protein
MKKRKQEQKERFAAAAGLFNATEGALSHWKFWTRLERLLERSDLPLRTVELVYLIAGLGLLILALTDGYYLVKRSGDERKP